jgi:hypothetical protein
MTNRILEQVSDWLKVLIKETGIPFLVVGIDGKVERILDANAQLSRLFAVRQTLAPFDCDPTNEASMQEFARFISYAEKITTIPLATALPRLELLQRLHYATDGVMGNLMNLLRYSAWLAQQQHQGTITLPFLAAAFEKRLARHVKGKMNPFLSFPEASGKPANPVNSNELPAESAPAKKKRRKSVVTETLKVS